MRRRTSRHVRFSPEPPLVIRDEIDVAGPPQRRPAAEAGRRRAVPRRRRHPRRRRRCNQRRHDQDHIQPRVTRSGRLRS